MTGRCPYCQSTRATQDDGAIVCEGCGAEFPTPDTLTPREREIVTLIRAGFTRHAIAGVHDGAELSTIVTPALSRVVTRSAEAGSRAHPATSER